MNAAQRKLFVAMSLLAPVFVACTAPPDVLRPVDVTLFDVDRTVVPAGESVTLSWEIVGDLETVELFRGAESLAKPTGAAGTQVAAGQPAGKTTYELVVRGQDKSEARRKLTVEGVTRPTVTLFTTDRTSVASGSSVVLSWQTVLATTVTLTNEDGVVIGRREGTEAAKGGLVVRPEASTEYTLEASGLGGTERARVNVSVLPRPTCTEFTASPTRALAGAPVTLRWATASATELKISMNDSPYFAVDTAAIAAGSRTIALDQSAVFTASLNGPGGPASCTTSVSVSPNPRITQFWADPSDVILGQPVTLRWATVGVDDIELLANGVPYGDCELTAGEGVCEVTQLTETTLFELVGTGAGSAASAELLVNVYGIPLVERFDSDRAVVYRNREPATLSWATRNGAVLSISDDFGNLVDTSAGTVASGTVTVAPNETTNYTLTLVGPGGTEQRQLATAITVDDPAPVVSLTSARAEIILAETTTLTWSVADHTTFTIEALEQGATTPVLLDLTGRAAADTITLNPAPTKTTTYTLVATGARPGLETRVSVSITVVRLPEFKVFEASKPIVTAGTTFDVRWETEFANYTELVNPTSGGFFRDTATPFASIRGATGTVSIPYSGSSTDNFYVDLPFPNGFSFPFFGGSYGAARMVMDGYLCFGGDAQCGSGTTFTNQDIPSATTPNNLIAAFWDDLEWATGRTEFLYRVDGVAPNRTMTFEWFEAKPYGTTLTAERLTFQVVLSEGGAWAIRHAPRPTPTGTSGVVLSSNVRWGDAATIGLEGPDGTAAQKFAYNKVVLCDPYVAGTASPETFGSCTPVYGFSNERLAASGTTQITAGATATSIRPKLRAVGPVGASSSPDILVRVVPAAIAADFTLTAVPPLSATRPVAIHVGAGETVNLFYTVTPTTAGVVRSYGIHNERTGQDETGVNVLSGFIGVAPTESTTYTLFAVNEANDRSTKQVAVTVAPPNATFALDRAEGPSGDSFKFTWTTEGARTVRLLDPAGNPVFTPLDFAQAGDQARIKAGDVTVPLTLGGVYTLSVQNGSGTTTKTVSVDVVQDLRIVSFTADKSEQTEGTNVVLSWETYNGESVSIGHLVADGPDEDSNPDLVLYTGMPLTTATLVRRGSFTAPVEASDTTYVITVAKADPTATPPVLTQTRAVTVASVPAAKVTRFAATHPNIAWNQTTTLEWTTERAVSAHLWTTSGTGQTATLVNEITSAANLLPSGSQTLRLVKSTGYALVVTNRLGTSVRAILDPSISVSVQPPQITTFTVTPGDTLRAGDTLPAGGFANISWDATQAEAVYLWQRQPETATHDQPIAANATATPATVARKEQVNVPYDYVPYNFVDISGTGAPLTLGWGSDPAALTAHVDNGHAIFDFPVDFRPHFFGEDMGRVMVSAEGGMWLAPPGAANAYFEGLGGSQGTSTTTCRTSTSGASCGTTAPIAIVHQPSTVASNRIFPFFSNLSGRNGCTTPSTCTTGRAPGTVYWQILGTAPDRQLIVQWDRWDASALANAGTLTFQAKLFENGDVEFQYKTLTSASAAFAKGGSAVVGVEKRGYKGAATSYFLAPAAANSQFLSAGDGYRIYCGRRPASGTLRTFFTQSTTADAAADDVTAGTVAARFPFRAVVINSHPDTPRTTKRVAPVRTLGQNDIFLNELMVNPVDGDDTGKEWIELRNRASSVANLTNFTIQTSSGEYTIPGGDIPAGGVRVLGQSNVTATNGNVAVDIAYGTGLQMDDAVDSVVLRYGNILVDRVEYDLSAGWTLQPTRSITMEAYGVTSHLDNDLPGAWCVARDLTGTGAKGSPGAANSSCVYDPTTRVSTNAAATKLQAAGDQVYTTNVALPFTFPFFGTNITAIHPSSNGIVGLGLPALTSSYDGNADPSAFASSVTSTSAPVDALFPFWDDLTSSGAAVNGIYALASGEVGNRRYVLHWAGFRNYNTDSTGCGAAGTSLTDFSAVLFESGRVEYHYHSMTGCGDGRSATVGYRSTRAAKSQTTFYGTSNTPNPAAPILTNVSFGLKLSQ